MMLRLTALMLGIGIGMGYGASAAAPIHVDVSGHVRTGGSQAIPAGSRLSVAALGATPTSDAYLLGAALLRQRATPSQTRLKAGLLFDLEIVAGQRESADLANAARAVSDQIADLPITGREVQLLDPRALEANPQKDRPALDGDKLVYPTRPETVTVTGAVTRPCTLRHSFLRDALSYRNSCEPLRRAASRDYLYVIQPDGRAQKLGIALWNQDAPAHLAPGAIVFVPLDEHQISSIAPDINEEAASFLATQVLTAPRASH
ncbi:capsule biosynthesis GfcC family protein [Stenotrophomonas sp. SMYL86]|jgi:hypothetical protein|uniref:capsule biosynthesis GfcC family protein n=1 Tax=Stenotrophomonas sp. SMYL86 TaxID=3076044 RepID=UPI002E79FA32|nr:capsule biosynthesis GfcC family protein [Stenotrophomonas sp. SMYL86]